MGNLEKTYFLPEKLKKELRKPWGKVILGNKNEVLKKFEAFLKKKKFKKIITVGDFCSQNLPSDIKIFDGKVKRKKFKSSLKASLKVKNPKSTIQKKAWEKIKKAIKENKNLFVEGEEDLLVIPAVLLSPQKTLIIYGLPSKGVCLIKVNKKIKQKIKNLLKRFKT